MEDAYRGSDREAYRGGDEGPIEAAIAKPIEAAMEGLLTPFELALTKRH